MPKERFDAIYRDLKTKIEALTYKSPGLLPSENTLKDLYGCSRNTIRRATAQLIEDGYVQAIHGKGVQVIYQVSDKTEFRIGGIESFAESALRNKKAPRTDVARLDIIMADDMITKQTGFPIGSELYYVERIRHLDDLPQILDISYFLKSEVGMLTEAIAANSIYDYLEKECKMQITVSKRRITAEKATAEDIKYLDLDSVGYDFVAVVSGQVYNSKGIMFEYTQARHRPDSFVVNDTAVRNKNN